MDKWNIMTTFLKNKDIGDVFTKMDICILHDSFEKTFQDTMTVYINNLIRVGCLERVGKNKFELMKRLGENATWSKLRQVIHNNIDFDLFA